LNSEKPLSHLGYLWVALLLLPVFSLFLGIYLSCKDGLVWDFSHDGIMFAVDYFSVQLSMAALSFPWVALVTANHRSGQAAKQIISQNAQNNFANYFLHREKFNDYIQLVAKDIAIITEVDAFKLYEIFFRKSSIVSVDPTISSTSSDCFIEIFHECLHSPTQIFDQKNTINDIKSYFEDFTKSIGVKTDLSDFAIGSGINKHIFPIFELATKALDFGITDSESVAVAESENQKIRDKTTNFIRLIRDHYPR